MQRLREQLPDVYPTGAQLRTLQRRVQLWRAEQVRRLIFEARILEPARQPNSQLIMMMQRRLSARYGPSNIFC